MIKWIQSLNNKDRESFLEFCKKTASPVQIYLFSRFLGFQGTIVECNEWSEKEFKKRNFHLVLESEIDNMRDDISKLRQAIDMGLVKQDMGADPASVCFDTLQSAKASGADVVIIDTAGRLHNKVNLMNELTKIKNVMAKIIPEAPHDVMLILDASTGQNAIEQATQFTKATEVDSITLTKLDGTAKGGVVIGISDQFKIPVRYIGVGEGMNDLQVFNKVEFVDSLFN